MKLVRRIADLPHPPTQSIGLVPTMGAFHQGHLDLMRRARSENDLVVVSLFVNPTQFGQGEDFERYPRDIERDSEMARDVGVDVLFAPSVEEVYRRSGASATIVQVPQITDRWEGAFRPGHFDGVATVVAKLFNMVRPTLAYFGQKDLQQCLVIKRMVADLDIPLKIEIVPTTREEDGLAMSSRNVYLSKEERRLAPSVYRELGRCAASLREGTGSMPDFRAELEKSRAHLTALGFGVDYFEWVSLEDLEAVRSPGEPSGIITAVRLGRTRLIDNIVF